MSFFNVCCVLKNFFFVRIFIFILKIWVCIKVNFESFFAIESLKKKTFTFASSNNLTMFLIITMRLNARKIFRKKIVETMRKREKKINWIRNDFLNTRLLLRVINNIVFLSFFLKIFLLKNWFLIITTTKQKNKKD